MDENSPEYLFNKEMEKLQSQTVDPNIQGMKSKKIDNQSIQAQRILNEVRTAIPPAPITSTQGDCPQCGLIHPPLRPGEKCPNAPLKIEGVDEISLTSFIVKVKDILSSQMEQKSVKDFKKFSSGMILTLMKYCEEYKE